MEIIENIVMMSELIYLAAEDVKYKSVSVRNLILFSVVVAVVVITKCIISVTGMIGEVSELVDYEKVMAFLLIFAVLLISVRCNFVGGADVVVLLHIILIKGVIAGIWIMLFSIMMALVTGIIKSIVCRHKSKSIAYIPFIAVSFLGSIV